MTHELEVEWRNPKWTIHGPGIIDLELNHPIHGWIPFTLNPNDKGAQFDAQELYDEVLEADASGATPIAPYKGPSKLEIWRERAALSWNEFLRSCMNAGILTASEVRVAAQNKVPAGLVTRMTNAGISKAEQDNVKTAWALAERVSREDNIVKLLAPLYDLDAEALDNIFNKPEGL